MRTKSKSSWPVVQLYTLDYRTQEHTGRRGQTQRDRARDTTYIIGQVIVQPRPLCDQCIIVVVVRVRAVENTGLCIAKFVKQKVIKIWREKEKRKKGEKKKRKKKSCFYICDRCCGESPMS